VKELYDKGAECTQMSERTNVHEEEQNGQPSVVSDDLV
jgi:hypothetical protein